MNGSNLVLKISALPFLAGLILGGWQLASATELACVNQTKESVATTSASGYSNEELKSDFTDQRRKTVKNRLEEWAKERLDIAQPAKGDAPAACAEGCVDKGIKIEVGKARVKFFERVIDTDAKKFDRLTPMEEGDWMKACIDLQIFLPAFRSTPEEAKTECENRLTLYKKQGPPYSWIFIITASATAPVTFTRLCDNKTAK